MRFNLLPLSVTIALVISGNAAAADARSIAMGGSNIANGIGVHGTFENPATLARLKASGEKVHLHLGGSADLRDSIGLMEIAEDNETLTDDFDNAVDALDGSNILCLQPSPTPDNVCLQNTAALGNVSQRFLDVLNDLSEGTDVDGQAAFDFGVASPMTPVPFAIHVRATATAYAAPNIAGSAATYAQEFATILSEDGGDGGTLTWGEIQNSAYIDVDTTNPTTPIIDFTQPEAAITSNSDASAVSRLQVGLSLARSFNIQGKDVDFGLTPKFSSLTARATTFNIADELDDNITSTFSDDFNNSEVTESTVTFDLGASMPITDKSIRVAAVLRNVIPETISVGAVDIETTPQLIVGGSYAVGPFSFSGDLALNSAKTDNLETQKMSAGVEFSKLALSLRAGIAHDAGRTKAPTAVTAGIGIGPLKLGARLAGTNEAQFGAQLSFGF